MKSYVDALIDTHYVDEASRSNLYVKTSELGPTAGLGLFASKDIKRGEVIAPYWGRVLSVEHMKKFYPGNMVAERVIDLIKTRFASAGSCKIFIDASKGCVASYANHRQGHFNAFFEEALHSDSRDDWLRLVANMPLAAVTVR